MSCDGKVKLIAPNGMRRSYPVREGVELGETVELDGVFWRVIDDRKKPVEA